MVEGKAPEAVAKLNRAVKAEANSLLRHMLLSRAHEALGQKQNAVRELATAAQLGSSSSQ